MMNEKFLLKNLPKMGTELELINTMINVAVYEAQIAEFPNTEVKQIAQEIMREKVLEIQKVLKNPSRFDKTSHDDLIS